MRGWFASLADALDVLAVLGGIGAIIWFMSALGTVETGPELIQVLLLGLALAIVPYCVSGAVHRIWQRWR